MGPHVSYIINLNNGATHMSIIQRYLPPPHTLPSVPEREKKRRSASIAYSHPHPIRFLFRLCLCLCCSSSSSPPLPRNRWGWRAWPTRRRTAAGNRQGAGQLAVGRSYVTATTSELDCRWEVKEPLFPPRHCGSLFLDLDLEELVGIPTSPLAASPSPRWPPNLLPLRASLPASPPPPLHARSLASSSPSQFAPLLPLCAC